MNKKLRDKVHVAMLSKSQRAEDVGDLTVVQVGFASQVARQLIIDEVNEVLSRIHKANNKAIYGDRASTVHAKHFKNIESTIEQIREEINSGQ